MNICTQLGIASLSMHHGQKSARCKNKNKTKTKNMVLNVHRNHKAYHGRGEGGMEVGGGGEGDYIPIATLSPPE